MVAPLDGARGQIAVYFGGEVKVVGRSGDGPGEYQGIRNVVYHGGSNFIVFSQGRETVLTGDDLEVAGTARLLLTPESVIVVDDSTRVIQTWRAAPGGGGYLLHLVRPSGVVSFGPKVPAPVQFRNPRAIMQALGTGTPDGFWSAPLDSYFFTRWDTEGRAVLTLSPGPPGVSFPKIAGSQTIDVFDSPPPPTVQAIREDSSGRLWVATMVARHDWRPLAPQQKLALYYLDRIAETVVEVLQPSTGDVLASQRLPFFITQFVNDSLAVSRVMDEYDVSTLQLLKLTIQPEVNQ